MLCYKVDKTSVWMKISEWQQTQDWDDRRGLMNVDYEESFW